MKNAPTSSKKSLIKEILLFPVRWVMLLLVVAIYPLLLPFGFRMMITFKCKKKQDTQSTKGGG